MALSDYKPEERVISLGETSFRVNVVSLQELAPLLRVHLPDLERLFEIFENLAEQDKQDIPVIAGRLISQAPGFAANLIAICAGEPDQATTAQSLSFVTQVQAVAAIAELTFMEVGGVKKGIEVLANLITKNGINFSEMMGKAATISKTIAA